MIIETERLILRPFRVEDAESIYEYAKDLDVGPGAGWPPHDSLETSREVIKNVLMVPYTYAVCLKSDNKAIGSISLMIGKNSNFGIGENEAELGFWIGKPFWGNGYIKEASLALLEKGFGKMRLERIWCAHLDENMKSARVQEKCGFRFHHKERKYWKIHGEEKSETVNVIERSEWEKTQE
ncbi:MAG: GNAT family N-acetyltransferase [Clostridia bacterium]|nr:GNAT family N-acetyltransferase [Clostridia bacterium]